MSWFQKLMPSRIRTEGGTTRKVPDGLWSKCKQCEAVLYGPELERSLLVCPKCDHHMSLSGRARLETFLDSDGRVELGTGLRPTDPLKFRDSKRYRDRLLAAQKATGEPDAMVTMRGRLMELPLIAKSLVVWARLTTLDQSRGSVLTSDDGHGAFDGIVSLENWQLRPTMPW